MKLVPSARASVNLFVLGLLVFGLASFALRSFDIRIEASTEPGNETSSGFLVGRDVIAVIVGVGAAILLAGLVALVVHGLRRARHGKQT